MYVQIVLYSLMSTWCRPNSFRHYIVTFGLVTYTMATVKSAKADSKHKKHEKNETQEMKQGDKKNEYEIRREWWRGSGTRLKMVHSMT